MKIISFISFVGFVALGAYGQQPPKKAQKQIVNGQIANIADYPYHAALLLEVNSGVEYLCGGAILSRFNILTAAHCTKSFSADELLVRTGNSAWDQGTSYSVERKTEHPSFSLAPTVANDVSVIKLTSPITYTTTVKSIKLAWSLPRAGTPAVVTGWGALYEDGTPVVQLRSVGVQTIADDWCRQYYGSYVSSSAFCAGYHSGYYDSCFGDSGGPLVSGGTVIGVVSWGQGCGQPSQPGVYANVPLLRSWIVRNVVFD